MGSQRGQQQHDVSKQHGIMIKADLQTSLDYCIVCNCLVFVDKVKIIHDCALNERAWMPTHSRGIQEMT